jgi:hypothetical protein
MAKLSDADMKAIFGAGYKPAEETDKSRSERQAAKRVAIRNTVIGFAVVVAIILLAVFFGPSGR